MASLAAFTAALGCVYVQQTAVVPTPEPAHVRQLDELSDVAYYWLFTVAPALRRLGLPDHVWTINVQMVSFIGFATGLAYFLVPMRRQEAKARRFWAANTPLSIAAVGVGCIGGGHRHRPARDQYSPPWPQRGGKPECGRSIHGAHLWGTGVQ